MIDINTLMLGNWVSYNGVPARVTSLDKDGKIGLEYVNYKVYEFSLEGVKLSQEILEKNPKVFGIMGYSFFNEGRSINGYWLQLGEGKLTGINYVHELQNALTLCGLVEIAKGFEV